MGRGRLVGLGGLVGSFRRGDFAVFGEFEIVSVDAGDHVAVGPEPQFEAAVVEDRDLRW